MLVVADTSPLNYLVQIDCQLVLLSLYKRVVIPPAVLAELSRADNISAVSKWLQPLPDWIEIRQTAAAPDPTLAALDPGEREAIQVAVEHQAELLLIDERRGRMEAQRRGLTTTGTLGVLLAAGQKGLIDAEAMYRMLLTTTNFRSAPELEGRFLRLVRESKKP